MTLSIDLFRQTEVRDLVFRSKADVTARHVPLSDIPEFDSALTKLAGENKATLSLPKVTKHLNGDEFSTRSAVAGEIARLRFGIETKIASDYEAATALLIVASLVAEAVNAHPASIDFGAIAQAWADAVKNTPGSELDSLLPDVWMSDLLCLYAKSSHAPDYRQLLSALARCVHVGQMFESRYITDGLKAASAPPDTDPNDSEDATGQPPVDPLSNRAIQMLVRSRIILPAGLIAIPAPPVRKPTPTLPPDRGTGRAKDTKRTPAKKKVSKAVKKKAVYRKPSGG